EYALIHGLITVVCCLVAAHRLRAWSQPELPTRLEPAVWTNAAAEKTALAWKDAEVRRRTAWLGEQPLLWKELHVEPMLWRGSIAEVFFMIIAAFGSVLAVGSFIVVVGDAIAYRTLEPMNIWATIVGTIVGTLIFILVAVRAAASLSSEREGQTLDSLL